jgi:hypothetical protein
MATDALSRRKSDAHADVKPIALQLLGSPPSSTSSSIEERKRVAMASNADAAYIEELDVDQALRSRNNATKSQSKAPLYRPQPSNKSGASSPAIERDEEDAPLLDPTAQNYGSGNNGGRRDGEYQGEGQADFEGLSWWNKPSVRASRYSPGTRPI